MESEDNEMKRSEQQEINRVAMEIFDAAILELNNAYSTSGVEWKRLRSCTAEVAETENYYILRSYDTLVACIEKATDTLADVLRVVYGYKSTSAQHIVKFRKARCYGGYGAGKWGVENILVAR